MTFLGWSRWFERLLLEEQATPARLAVMGWIIAHASSDGTGFAIDGEDGRDGIASEIGLTAAEVAEEIQFLIDRRYVELAERGPGEIRGLRVIFDRVQSI